MHETAKDLCIVHRNSIAKKQLQQITALSSNHLIPKEPTYLKLPKATKQTNKQCPAFPWVTFCVLASCLICISLFGEARFGCSYGHADKHRISTMSQIAMDSCILYNLPVRHPVRGLHPSTHSVLIRKCGPH